MRKRIQPHLHMSWLILVNLFRLRQLRVLDFYTERRFVYNATRTDIYWNVKGCHKIKVEGYGTYPGNVNGVSMLEKKEAEHIVVTFFGWANNHTHVFHIPASMERVLHTFRNESEKRLKKQRIVGSNGLNIQAHWQLTNQIESYSIKPINIILNSAISNLSVSFTSPKIHVS